MSVQSLFSFSNPQYNFNTKANNLKLMQFRYIVRGSENAPILGC